MYREDQKMVPYIASVIRLPLKIQNSTAVFIDQNSLIGTYLEHLSLYYI